MVFLTYFKYTDTLIHEKSTHNGVKNTYNEIKPYIKFNGCKIMFSKKLETKINNRKLGPLTGLDGKANDGYDNKCL